MVKSVQINLVRPKAFWTDQNCFGHIEGQGIKANQFSSIYILGKVFEAEKMTSKSGLYHKKCFTCGNCKRALDYQLCTEGPDGNVYCKLCYSHMYGHKAKPDLNTADVAAIQGQEGEATTCPRYFKITLNLSYFPHLSYISKGQGIDKNNK